MANHPIIQQRQSEFDRLLLLQCAIRRFRQEHPAALEGLRALRKGLVEALGTSLRPEAWLSDLFWLVDRRSGREALRSGRFDVALDQMGHAGSPPRVRESLMRALSALAAHLDLVEDLLDRFNYFDFFGLLPMTGFCHGELLCLELDRAMSGVIGLPEPGARADFQPWPPGSEVPEDRLRIHRLLSPMYQPADLDVACALLGARTAIHDFSPSITLKEVNPRRVEAPSGGRALQLRIDLHRAPAEIDQALDYLRVAIQQALQDEHGEAFDAPMWEEYRNSGFFRSGQPKPIHFRQWNEVLPAMLGLWLWDLVRDGTSVAHGQELIQDTREAWRRIHLYALPTSQEQALGKQYRGIDRLISAGHAEAGDLDHAIARTCVRLGPRVR